MDVTDIVTSDAASATASDETASSEDMCADLFTTMVSLAVQSRDVDKQFKTIIKKMEEKSIGSSLSPKAATTRWLRTVGLPHETLSYEEFATAFFTLYEKEGRLDFATRTVELRPTEAKLLELPADQPVSVFQFLGSIPKMFH
jgi:hypothetical protein